MVFMDGFIHIDRTNGIGAIFFPKTMKVLNFIQPGGFFEMDAESA